MNSFTILKYQYEGFFLGLIFFIRFFEYLCRTKKENFTVTTCDFDFKCKILVKIVGDVMKQCKKLFTTCVYLCYSNYLFLEHRSSEYPSFWVFILKEKSTLEKKVNFKSYMQFLNLIIHMKFG